MSNDLIDVPKEITDSTVPAKPAKPTDLKVEVIKDSSLEVLDKPWFQDQNPGVLSFQREVPAPQELPFTREQADRCRDHQLAREPGKLSLVEQLEEESIRRHAQRACSACPGHCCLAFVMGGQKKDWRRNLRHDKKRRRNLLARLARPFPPNVLTQQPHLDIWMEVIRERDLDEIKKLEINIQEAEFCIKNFVRALPKIENSKNRCGFTYWCRKFDPVARRCTTYHDRPHLCHAFVCGAATVGVPPTGKHMQTKCVPRAMELIRRQDIYDPAADFGED